MIVRLGSSIAQSITRSITQPCSPLCGCCSLNRIPFFVSFVLFVVNSLRPPVLLRNRHPSRANRNQKSLPTRNDKEPVICPFFFQDNDPGERAWLCPVFGGRPPSTGKAPFDMLCEREAFTAENAEHAEKRSRVE